MSIVIDNFEYSTNPLAQGAYVTSEVSVNDDPTSAMLSHSGIPWFNAVQCVDNNVGTHAWYANSIGDLVKVDLGAGNEKAYVKARLYALAAPNGTYSIQYSDNDSDWYDAATGFTLSDVGWNEKTWTYVGAHRYWRFYVTDAVQNWIEELEFYSQVLQCFSESTIKQQGSYSLKGFAQKTNSLNDTLTRTVSATIDLTNVPTIKLYIRSTRTGSNIKIGIRDSGSTITEITPNITTANVFQLVEWDISGVSPSDKDTIDRVIATIVNADSNTEFYLDSMSGVVVYAETYTETISLSDSYSRVCTWFRTFSDTITLTDSVKKAVSKRFSETITLADSLHKKVTKTFTESITLTDIYSRVWRIYRTFTENINLIDTFRKRITKTFIETLHLQDTYTRVVSWYRTFTEKITLIDTITKVKSNLVQLWKKLINLFDIEG